MPFPFFGAKERDDHLHTAKRFLVETLTITEKLLDGFPIPGAKGTIGAALHFITEAERTAANAELCVKLREHILGLQNQLIQPLVGKTKEDIPPSTLTALEAFTRHILDGLEQLKHPRLSEYGRFRSYLYANEIEGDLRMVMERIRLDTESNLVGGVLRLELAVQSLEDRQRDSKRQDALEKLRRAPEAKLDSHVQPLDDDGKLLLCFKDTRTAIVEEIMKWIIDPSSPPIFWLHGLAGTGKSTIARTVGIRAKAKDYITASFFFSGVGGTAGLRDPAYVFPTLAHQLAASNNDLNRIIGDAVMESSDIDHGMVLDQFQTLIAAPLDAWHAKSKNVARILIILDAVDECQGVADSRPQQILTCLRDHKYQAPSHVRILLTSRPEYHIRQELVHHHQVLEHDLYLDDESARGDIAQLLKAKLPLIPGRLGIKVEKEWPPDEDVEALSEKSGHLFIFAKTALRFIGDDQVLDPKGQMSILLGMDKPAANTYSLLDKLYGQVLESALSEDRVADHIFLRFRRVVGCIILSQDALSVSEIASITGYSVSDVMAVLRRTHSTIYTSPLETVDQRESDLLPRVYHPSFSHYLVNPKRCVNPHFTIDPTETHGFIVLRCFQLMKAFLRRNILNIPNQTIFIPGLRAKVQSTIPPESAYACRFWISHLLESEIDEKILEALHNFLSRRFLWWCEALSLLDSARNAKGSLLGAAASTLRIAWERLINTSCNAEITDLLNDTHRFLIFHHRTISRAAMHTYYTALPFTPHDTCLYRLYEGEASHSIKVLQGLDPIWSSCLANLDLKEDTSIVRTSPDGTCLAVGGRDSISLWDTRTTALQRYIHNASISQTRDKRPHSNDSLAFSSSESTVATVWGGTLYVSDTSTETKRITRELNGDFVYAAAFSSGGQYLLLSIDQNLHLYRGTDAIELAVLPTDQHHTSAIFTRDDGEVITGSEKGWVHFFKLSSDTLSEIPGRSISTQAGVVGLVLCHDGQSFATSGMDGAIRIYDLPSLGCVATLQRPGSESAINAMAYHPKEEELAAGQDECLVLWKKETAGDWVPSIHGHHTSPIIGVGYCENGTRIYAGSQDGHVKLWENTKAQSRQPPKHQDVITCYAVDSGASLLATGSRDMSVILWALTEGDYLRRLLEHKSEIVSLEFSGDGVHLASSSSDDRAIVWDVASGNVLHVLGPHSGCGRVLAFSEDHRHLTTATSQEIYVWELESEELMEVRERNAQVNSAQKRPYNAFTLSLSEIQQAQDAQDAQQDAQVAQQDAQDAQQVSQDAQQRAQEVQQAQEALGRAQRVKQEAQREEREAQRQMRWAKLCAERLATQGWTPEAQEAKQRAQEARQQAQQARQQAQEAQQEAQQAQQEAQQAQRRAQETQRRAQGPDQRALEPRQWAQEAQERAQEVAQRAQEAAQRAQVARAARDNDNEKWATKYLQWRLPAGYGVDTTLVMQERVVLLCMDGRILILDMSRMD